MSRGKKTTEKREVPKIELKIHSRKKKDPGHLSSNSSGVKASTLVQTHCKAGPDGKRDGGRSRSVQNQLKKEPRHTQELGPDKGEARWEQGTGARDCSRKRTRKDLNHRYNREKGPGGNDPASSKSRRQKETI